MHVHVLFDTKGKVHECTPSFILSSFHPSKEADAPRLEFHPARGQRVALLEVPAELEGLSPRALHAAVVLKLHKDGPSLVKRKR